MVAPTGTLGAKGQRPIGYGVFGYQMQMIKGRTSSFYREVSQLYTIDMIPGSDRDDNQEVGLNLTEF